MEGLGPCKPPHQSVGKKIIAYARTVFIVGKCCLMIYQMIVYAFRYKRSYKVCCQFEIWYFLMGASMITVLLPCIFLKEVNYLFYCFWCNSAIRYWLSYTLQTRSQIGLYKPLAEVKKTMIWLLIRWILLGSLLLIPIFGGD